MSPQNKRRSLPPTQGLRALMAAILLAVLAPGLALADDSPRNTIESGFSAYLKDGIEAAMHTWLKDGPYENDTKLIASFTDAFSRAEATIGKPESYEIVKETVISPRTRAVFCIMYYPKGEEFFLFQMYRSKDGEWLVTNMEYNNHIFEVIPKDVLLTR